MIEKSSDYIDKLKSQIKIAEELRKEVVELGDPVKFDWNAAQINFQRWFRSTMRLMELLNYSGREEFEKTYNWGVTTPDGFTISSVSFFQFRDANLQSRIVPFVSTLNHCISLIEGAIAELEADLPSIISEMSMEYAADLFSEAEHAFKNKRPVLAALLSGIALEQHVKTICETHGVSVKLNPPNKKHADFSDYVNSLYQQKVINKIQMRDLQQLYGIRTSSKHDDDKITDKDIMRLIREGKRMVVELH